LATEDNSDKYDEELRGGIFAARDEPRPVPESEGLDKEVG